MRKTTATDHPLLGLDLPTKCPEDYRFDLFEGLPALLKQRLVRCCPGMISKHSALLQSFMPKDLPLSERWKTPSNAKTQILSRHQITLEKKSTEELQDFYSRVEALRLKAAELGKDCELDELTAVVLVQRNVDKLDDLKQYLHPSFEKELANMPHWEAMDKAVDAILLAHHCHRRIVLIGDYDVDGNCSLAIMKRTLERLGVKHNVIQPDRDLHGYGLSDKLMPQILASRPDLIITLDIGTTSRKQIEFLKQRGCFTIVVDHHQPQGHKAASPHIMCNAWENYKDNPKLFDYGILPASGQAVFLASKLLKKSSLPPELIEAGIRSTLTYGMMGIIADMAALTGANRTICKEGFKEFMLSVDPGITILREQLGNRPLTAEYIGFFAGPGLNASGRMRPGTSFSPGTAPAQSFLTTSDLDQASLSFSLIQAYNQERKLLQDKGIELARDLVSKRRAKGEPYHFGGVFYIPEAHKGVVGLIASHLCKFLHAPVVVMTKNREGFGFTGSGRAPAGLDLLAILQVPSVNVELSEMGGHAPAAGMSCKDFESLKRFRVAFEKELNKIYCEPDLSDNPFVDARETATTQRVSSWINQYKPDLLIPLTSLADSQEQILKTLLILEPCGMGNPTLQVLVPKVKIEAETYTDAGHRRLILEDCSDKRVSPPLQKRLNSVMFKGSLADRFIERSNTEVQDLLVQPSFELPFISKFSSQKMSLQVVYGQTSKFINLNLLATSFKRPQKPLKKVQASKFSQKDQPNQRTIEFGELSRPKFQKMQEFCRYFGGIELCDTIEFRPEQVDFLTKQLLLEQEPGPKNLIASINTGGGKTIVALIRAAKALLDYPERKVIYLTTDAALVDQAFDMATAALPLANDQILKLTGAIPAKKRLSLYQGEAKIFVATPQTFWGDLNANPDLINRFSLVLEDEIQIIAGDSPFRDKSLYAYRSIAELVLEKQKEQSPITLWAFSGTPAKNDKELGLLARTLQARFEKAQMNTGQQLMRLHGLDLKEDQRLALNNLRSAYHDCARELFQFLDKLTSEIKNTQFTRTSIERSLFKSIAGFKKIHEIQKDGRTLPGMLSLLDGKRELEQAINNYLKTEGSTQTAEVWGVRTRLHELGYLRSLFAELLHKGRIPFIRYALDKIAGALYAKDEVDKFSSYKVRAHRRKQVRQSLEWAADSPVAKELITVFNQSYPNFHRPENVSFDFVAAKKPPPPWRELKSLSQFQSENKKVSAAIDAALKKFYVENKLFDPKEQHLTTDAALKCPKKVIFCEEIFEAELLAARLQALGANADWYAGKSVGKKAGMASKLEKFNRGEISILCSTSAGETGKDFSNLFEEVRIKPYVSGKKNRQTIGRLARGSGQSGTCSVMTNRDPDPDFDERTLYMYSQHALRRLEKVGEVKPG